MADRHKNRTKESEALRQRLRTAAAADIGDQIAEALKKVSWARRNRGRKDIVFFLKTYCTGEGGFLETPPPASMQGIPREMAEAVGDSSVPYHIRIARGHGKTSFVKGVVKWCLSYGIRRFVVAVAASTENAKEIVDDIYTGMMKNPNFVQDFPEIAIPLIMAEGNWQRAAGQAAWGEKTEIQKKATSLTLPTVRNQKTKLLYPGAGGILIAVGFSSGARGKVRMTQRPDLVIFDDLQTDDLAGNEARVQAAAAKLKKTFLGLAGHRKKIAALMTSTPIERNDLSELFAKDKGWRTSTYPMLKAWPSCYHKEGVADHWEAYNDIFQAAKLAGRPPHIEANAYYKEHRAEMDAGAEVLNPGNFDAATELSGIQHAMNLLFRDGREAFLCEYQMSPPEQEAAFEISANMVLSRVRPGTLPHTVPPATVLTVGAVDLNPSYGFTFAGLAFDVNLTGLVPFYGIHRCNIPDDLNEVEFGRRVYEELAAMCREIGALGVRLDMLGIDAGGRQFAPVNQFAPMAEGFCGIKATAMIGRAGRNWNPNVRTRIRHAVNETVLCRDPQRRTWMAFNADAFKEKVQKAWGTEVGAPGGLSLFDGGVNHYKFATQVANEKIVSKRQEGDRVAYKWNSKNPHDYLDCLAMCYALAASVNLTGEGSAAPRRRTGKVSVGGASIAAAAHSPAPEETAAPAPQFAQKKRVIIGHR